MEHTLQAETAKLSLVGKHGQSIDVSSPQHGYDNVDDIVARLPAVLQTSLDLETIIALFDTEISKILPYDSLHYQHQGVHCDVNTGRRSHHSCNYRLEMNSVWLGEITLTRRTKFTNADTQLFEDLLCKLIYPVRNCLLFSQAQAAALQDKLTGLNNRGAFDASLKREVNLAHRQHSPMSLIVLDIDHFKTVNDNYGHSSGDLALQILAQSITDTMRLSDIAFRYGGEEFGVILPETNLEGAIEIVETIRKAVEQLDLTHKYSDVTDHITISGGVATVQPAKGDDIKEVTRSLIQAADKSLYLAKKHGRNQVIAK